MPLPDIPILVLGMLSRFVQPLLAWISQLIAQTVITRCADHPLVQLNRGYDPQGMVDACCGFHHADGHPGRLATSPIA